MNSINSQNYECIYCDRKFKSKTSQDWHLIMTKVCKDQDKRNRVEVNRCAICKEDLGDSNPRQLCGKTYCYKIY